MQFNVSEKIIFYVFSCAQNKPAGPLRLRYIENSHASRDIDRYTTPYELKSPFLEHYL